MLRFRINGNGMNTIFLGLSDANIAKLQSGQPIKIDEGDEIGLGVEVVIFHGATEVDMARELEERGLLPEGSAVQTKAATRPGDGPTTIPDGGLRGGG
jgi:hypothetical protein